MFHMFIFNWRLDAEDEIWKTQIKYRITPHEYRCFYLTPIQKEKNPNIL